MEIGVIEFARGLGFGEPAVETRFGDFAGEGVERDDRTAVEALSMGEQVADGERFGQVGPEFCSLAPGTGFEPVA